MKVNITIEREDGDELSTSMGISASGMERMEVFSMLLAGAEMVAYEHVRDSLIANGTTQDSAEYAAPLRTRLLAMEVLLAQEMQPYSWVQLNLNDDTPGV